ncbi:MAG: hypothetical protein ACRDZR_12365 [Acidimicrobiales bacterium]
MRSGIRAVVGAALLCGGVVGGLASTASASSASGPTKVFVKPTETTSVKHPGKILLTGAVGDYGTVISANAAGKATRKGTYRLLRLKKGTILVDIATFQKALESSFTSPTALDQTTCSIAVSPTGPVAVVSGTGSYSGISGSFTMTAFVAGIAPRTASGACTVKTTTAPLATFTVITGTGTVTVP